MPDVTDNLLARLRATLPLSVVHIAPDGTETQAGDGTTSILRNPDGPEAAARIETMAARIEALRSGLAEASEAIGVCVAGFKNAEKTTGGMAAIHMLTEAQERYAALAQPAGEEDGDGG